jgi:hypothetical protein
MSTSATPLHVYELIYRDAFVERQRMRVAGGWIYSCSLLSWAGYVALSEVYVPDKET